MLVSSPVDVRALSSDRVAEERGEAQVNYQFGGLGYGYRLLNTNEILVERCPNMHDNPDPNPVCVTCGFDPLSPYGDEELTEFGLHQIQSVRKAS